MSLLPPKTPAVRLFAILFILSTPVFSYSIDSDYFLIGDFAYDAVEYGGAKDAVLGISTSNLVCEINVSSGSNVTCLDKPWNNARSLLYVNPPVDSNDPDPYGGQSKFIEMVSHSTIYGYSQSFTWDWYLSDINGGDEINGSELGYSQMDLGHSDSMITLSSEYDAWGRHRSNAIHKVDVGGEINDKVTLDGYCVPVDESPYDYVYYDSVAAVDSDSDGAEDDYILGYRAVSGSGEYFFIQLFRLCNSIVDTIVWSTEFKSAVQVASADLDDDGEREGLAVVAERDSGTDYLSLIYQNENDELCRKNWTVSGLSYFPDGDVNVKAGNIDSDPAIEVVISYTDSGSTYIQIGEISVGTSCDPENDVTFESPILLSTFGITANAIREVKDLTGHGSNELILSFQDSRWDISRFSVLGFDDTLSINPLMTSTNTKRRGDTSRTSYIGSYAYSELPIEIENQGNTFVSKFDLAYSSSGSDAGDSVSYNADTSLSIAPHSTSIFPIRYEHDTSLRTTLGTQYIGWTDSNASIAGGKAIIKANIDVINTDVITYNATYDISRNNDDMCKSGWSFDSAPVGEKVTVPNQTTASTTHYPVNCSKSGVLPVSGQGWKQDTSKKTLAGKKAHITGDVLITNDAEVTLNVSVGADTVNSAARSSWTCFQNASSELLSIASLAEGTIYSGLICNRENVISAGGTEWYQINESFNADSTVTIRGKLRLVNSDTIAYADVVYNNSAEIRDSWNCEIEEGIIDMPAGSDLISPDYNVNCTGKPINVTNSERVADGSYQVVVDETLHSVMDITIENFDSVDYANVNWSFNTSDYSDFTVEGITDGQESLGAYAKKIYPLNFSAVTISMQDKYENSTGGYELNFTIRNNDSVDYEDVFIPIAVNQTKLLGGPLNISVFWNESWMDITPETFCEDGFDSFNYGFRACMNDTDKDTFVDTYLVIQPNSTEANYSLSAQHHKYMGTLGVMLFRGNTSHCSVTDAINMTSSLTFDIGGTGKGWVYIRKTETSEFNLTLNSEKVTTFEALDGGDECGWMTQRFAIRDPDTVELSGEGYLEFFTIIQEGTDSVLYPENTTVLTEAFSIEEETANMTFNTTKSEMQKIYLPNNLFSNFYYSLYFTNNSSHNISTTLDFEGWSDTLDFEVDADPPVINSVNYSSIDVISNILFTIQVDITDPNLDYKYVRYNYTLFLFNNSSLEFMLTDLGASSGNVTISVGARDRVYHETEQEINLRVSELIEESYTVPKTIAMHIHADTVPASHDWSGYLLIEHLLQGLAENVSFAKNYTLGEPWAIDNVSGVQSFTQYASEIEIHSRNYSENDSEEIWITYNISDAFDIVYRKEESNERAYVLIDNVSLNSDYHRLPNIFVNTSLPRGVNLSDEHLVIGFCDIPNPNNPFECLGSWETYENASLLPLITKTHTRSFDMLTDRIEFRIPRASNLLVKLEFAAGAESMITPDYIRLDNILKDYQIDILNTTWNDTVVEVGTEYGLNISFFLSGGHEAYYYGFNIPAEYEIEGHSPVNGFSNFSEPLLIDSEIGPLLSESYTLNNLTSTLITETDSSYSLDSDTYTIQKQLTVYSDMASDGSIIYSIFTQSFLEFSKRTASPTVLIDGRNYNVSWELLGGDNILRIIIGENFGNSSLHSGEHNVSIIYDIEEEEEEEGGSNPPSPPGGGSGRVKVPMKANVSWDELNATVNNSLEFDVYLDNTAGCNSLYTFNYSSVLPIYSQLQSLTLNSDELGVIHFLLSDANTSGEFIFYLTLRETHLDMNGYAEDTFNITINVLELSENNEDIGEDPVNLTNISQPYHPNQTETGYNVGEQDLNQSLVTGSKNTITGLVTFIAGSSPAALAIIGLLVGSYVLFSILKNNLLTSPVKNKVSVERVKPVQTKKEEKIPEDIVPAEPEKRKMKKFGIDVASSENKEENVFGTVEELASAEEELKKYFVEEE